MKPINTLKCCILALPLCVGAPYALAETLDQGVAGVTAGQDTLLEILGKTKKFKPSFFPKALGNNAARNAVANSINMNIANTLAFSKKYNLPMVSQAADVLTSGVEALTRSYYGDFTGTGTVVLHSAVSKVTVAGAAMAGGKVFAYVGAVAGAWVPVVGPAVGGVVGGVVGSVGGAAVASYSIGSDAVKDWFSSKMESYFLKDEAYYENLAKQNREEYLADKAQQAAIAKGEQAKAQAAREFGYDLRPGSSDNAEIQFSAAKLPDFEMPQTEASDPGKTTPLFASNFTVQITSWVNPEFTGTEKFIIKEGEVSAYINAPVPIAPEYYTSGRREGAFKGRIEANKITGTWADSFRYTFVPGKSNCAGPMLNTMKTQIELILNQGGSVSGRIIGGTSQLKVSGCPNGEVNRTEQVPANTLQGEWKIIE